ncbi:MAG TPA: SGNH/GDSL hydrolase family protein [Planctomycetaceae bacterium]|nr:SGNH/GDSL hydrolase family protein [Planctomycetaceae bacterium]
MIRSCFLWCKHLAYAVLVLALLICLVEVGLRVYDSATAQVTRRELYDRGMVCKSWFVHHTLKPSHAFAVKDPDTGLRVRVAVNSLGLRGPEPAIPKPPGTYRIVCLGDDSTFAATTADPETFCALLPRELAGRAGLAVEVINAGVPDYCPLLEYLLFRHVLLPLEADLVVLCFDMSDIADDYLVRRYVVMSPQGLPLACAHPALEMPRGVGKANCEGLLLCPQVIRQRVNCLLADRVLSEKSRSIESPHCRYLWLEDHPPDWSTYISQALGPIKHLDDLVRRSGGRLVVAACPAPWQISAAASNGEGVREQAGVAREICLGSRRPFEALAEFCQSHQIPFCDVSGAFAQASRPELLFLKNAAAFSSEGHALFARQLSDFLLHRLRGADFPSPGLEAPQPQARLVPP